MTPIRSDIARLRLAVRTRFRQIPFLLALIGACNSGSTTPPPPPPTYSMVAFAGDNQRVLYGTDVPIPPAVKIADAAGHPVAGVAVIFTPHGQNGAGTVTGAMPTTDASGVAVVGSWQLSGSQTQSLEASAPAIDVASVTFTAIVVGPAGIQRQSGENQTVPIGTAVPVKPSVIVIDILNFERPIAGLTVTFTVVDGGGNITGATALTDAQGVATLGSWTMGPAPGANHIRATADWPGSPSTTFVATATALLRR
jgi:hypothetical protein